MKKLVTILFTAVTMMFIMSTMSSAATIKPKKDIAIKDIDESDIKIRFTNRTKSDIQIDQWAMCLDRSSCCMALSLVKRKGSWDVWTKRQIIKKGKTKTIHFTSINPRYEIDSYRKFCFNFSVGGKKRRCIITTRGETLADDSEYIEYSPRIEIKKGFRSVPYRNYNCVIYSDYKRIKDGMTYKQVCDIFDAYGELTSSSSSYGHTYTTYQWEGWDDYSYAMVSFDDGLSYFKSQNGL